MADSATYLYAITRDAGGATATELTGVAGTDLRALSESGLRAYVSTVPLDQFDEAALRRNLEDLAWLEATARAHNDVVEAVARTTPTAPVRLVTVYRSDDHVRHLLAERAEEFEGVLAEIDGRTEWGVKVYTAPGDRSREGPGDGPDHGPGGAADQSGAADAGAGAGSERSGPGAAYLRRRRTSLRSREDARRRALSRAEQVDATLAAIAVASRRHPPQDPQLSGRSEWMVLNGAYLVDEDRGEEFAAAVESLRTPDVDLHVTGPWAPYSFAILETP